MLLIYVLFLPRIRSFIFSEKFGPDFTRNKLCSCESFHSWSDSSWQKDGKMTFSWTSWGGHSRWTICSLSNRNWTAGAYKCANAEAAVIMPSFAASSPLAAVSNWSPEYRWIPVAGGFVNFVWSVAVGANDVAISVCPHVWFSQCWLSNFINCSDKHALSNKILMSSNFDPGSAFCCPGTSPDSTTLQCVNETESEEAEC